MNSFNELFYLPNTFSICQIDKGFASCSTRSFSRDIKNIYKNSCFITGESINNTTLVAHHLYSRSEYPSLEFRMLNAIPLKTSLHKTFHKLYGNATTPESFIHFLNYSNDVHFQLTEKKKQNLIKWIEFLDLNIKN